MNNMSVQLKALTKYMILFFMICAIAWFSIPLYKSYILGFALGAAVGLINARYLSIKIEQLTLQIETKANKRINIGFLTRASMAVLAIILAIHNDNIEAAAVILGLVVVPIVALVVGFMFVRSHK